ncbi:hypothetical protein LRP52_48600 [Photobacterium sp. ZSDE20]|nr:hypothetical protein [Photobacterium sp. ZSDE20]
MKQRIESALKAVLSNAQSRIVEDYEAVDDTVNYEVGNIRNELYSNKPQQLAFSAFAEFANKAECSEREIELMVSSIDWISV